MNYLVCYDIRDPGRLRRTARTLEQYGIRLQYSFFEMDANSQVLKRMIRDVKRVIDLSVDSFNIYPICKVCKKAVLIDGSGGTLSDDKYHIY